MIMRNHEANGATLPSSLPADPLRKNPNDDFRLSIYRGTNGDWYHRLVSVHNGQNVLREGYRNKQHLVDLLERVMPGLEIHEESATSDELVEHPYDLQPHGEGE